MEKIVSRVRTTDDDYRANRERMLALVAELKERVAGACVGGDERSRERHKSRGKLLARERIDALVDPTLAFLELSPLAATACTTARLRAGIVTGIGAIHGRDTMIVANDATVKGGTYFP
jgi:3-methylcrotonyl-CoA carboxylase beta subunit